MSLKYSYIKSENCIAHRTRSKTYDREISKKKFNFDKSNVTTRSVTFRKCKRSELCTKIKDYLQIIEELTSKSKKILVINDIYDLIYQNKYYLKFMGKFGVTCQIKLIELHELEDKDDKCNIKEIANHWYAKIFNSSIVEDTEYIKKSLGPEKFSDFIINRINKNYYYIMDEVNSQ